MGSPVSTMAENLYMKAFENKELRTADKPSRLWKGYVDEPFVIQDIEHKDKFSKHQFHRQGNEVHSEGHLTWLSNALSWHHNNTNTSKSTFYRFKEHHKAPSPIYECKPNTGYNTSVEDFIIADREGCNSTRTIRESIHKKSTAPPSIGTLVIITFHIFETRVCLPPKNSKLRTSKNSRNPKCPTPLVPSTLRCIVEENISCGPYTPKGYCGEKKILD